MSKLNQDLEVSNCSVDEAPKDNEDEKTSEKTQDIIVTENEEQTSPNKKDDNEKDILKFTMLINKFNSDLDLQKEGDEKKRNRKNMKCTMFFNKEVTIRSNLDESSPLIVKSLGPSEMLTKDAKSSVSVKLDPFEAVIPKLESEKPFVPPQLCNPVQPDLRIHNSLTSLSKSIKLGLKGVLKSKIPSMTIIETNSILKSGNHKLGSQEDKNNTIGSQTELDMQGKCFNLQISKSNNDNNRRSQMRFKKEEVGSVSDSKLLNADSNRKKHLKKCDKKSRGDSSKEAHVNGGRKQVQWKAEVDVIYFSTRHSANGSKRGEIIERVMEPLREEWEQQRKGFYAKIVSYHIESHLKDHFISLLKI